MTDNFINTALSLAFPEPTEAEKQLLVDQAVRELAYEAAVSQRAKMHAELRRADQTRKRLKALVSGGYVFCPVKWPRTPNGDGTWNIMGQYGPPASTRGERRRDQLGRT